MHSTLLSLLSLSSLVLVNAAPLVERATSSAAAATASTFSLPNGFPSNVTTGVTAIEQQAHGLLPDGAPPASITADDITSLQLIAFNEIFEVAFFTSLLHNITTNVKGYTFSSAAERQTVINAITAVQAQEEIHALTANAAIAYFKGTPIEACKYKFPVSDFASAIALASTFTDVVLGTLGEVAQLLGKNGDSGLITQIAAVIGQEGEQNGYYRSLLGKIPSSGPLLSASTREFAYSALNQDFVVAGSCPNSKTIDLPVFGPLLVTSNVTAKSTSVDFAIYVPAGTNVTAVAAAYSLVYINQQNVPVVVAPTNVVAKTSTLVTFSAPFPYAKYEMNGLTIAAVVTGKGPFANAAAVANATALGPGLIEIN